MSTSQTLNSLTLALLIGGPIPAFAQVENSWNGNGTTANWSEAGNWDLLGGLVALDTVVFPMGPTNSPVNTNDTALALSGLQVHDTYEIWGNALIMASNAPITATRDAVLHAGLSYPDAVEDSANWNVTAGATLTLNGNINAPAQGNTNSGVGITGYARKTGQGTLRLAGSDNRFHSGMNLRSGTIVLDGASLWMTNQNFRLSASGTNTIESRLVVTNNANLTLGFDDIASNTQLDFGYSDPGRTNIVDMEDGTLTVLGRGWLGLCTTADDVAVVNHNGGTIDCQRDNGPGVQLISGGGALAEYNLNGGTLNTKVIVKNTPGSGKAVLNFNGGTLVKNSSGGNSLGTTFLRSLDEVNILDGGAIVDLGTFPTIITNQLIGVGSGGFTKRGSALLQFRGEFVTNTFDGPVVIEEGELQIRHQYHLGDNTNVVNILSNASLHAQLNNEPNKELYVHLVMEAGSTVRVQGGARPAADMTANGPFNFEVSGFSSILASIDSGSPDAAIIKTGSGNLQFSGDQTYSLLGSNVVADGKLRLNGSPVTLGSLSVLSGNTELELAGIINGPITIESGALAWRPGFGDSVVGNGNIETVVMNSSLTIQSGAVGVPVLTDLQIDSGAWTNISPDTLDVAASDRVVGLTTVTYGSDLWVTDVAAVPSYAAGQVYTLFEAESYAGAFDSEGGPVLASPPGPNLAWDTSGLTVDGTIRVVSTLPAPAPEPLVVDVQGGTNLVVSWTDPAWHLEAQSQPIHVGLTDTWHYYPGTSPVTIPVTSTNLQTFFLRLAYP